MKKMARIENNLFFWALLNNYIDLAKIFWSRAEHQIANALLASKMLKSMSKIMEDEGLEDEAK